MSEQCPIRTAEFKYDDSLTDAGIPSKCMGCLALAMSEEVSSTKITSDTYNEAVKVMTEIDGSFEAEGAESWASTMFVIPDESPHREAKMINGFDEGGDPFGAVFSEEIVIFNCPTEQP